MTRYRLFLTTFVLCVDMLHAKAIDEEPNPPTWPSSVRVYSPSDKDFSAITDAYTVNGGHDPPNHGQFSEERFAFMFEPGTYDVDVPVGYYTQIIGLGEDPDDVIFSSPKGVYAQEQDYSIGGALSTFWRSAENFKSLANFQWYVGSGMMWATSQATPLRRVEVENDLLLFEYEPPISAAGESSGGFFSNIKVNSGTVKPGSQQQWFARDSTLAAWVGGVWNFVFTGVVGAPPSHCGNDNGTTPSTNVPNTPQMSEKPYITIDNTTGKYSLRIPPVKTNSMGHDFDNSKDTVIPFENVYVTIPSSDTAETINKKLAEGKHVVFSPGVYKIDTPLIVDNANTTILGLGLATLVAARDTASVIQIGDVDGVRVCGLILQAGPVSSSLRDDASNKTLLTWGTGRGYPGSVTSPGFLHDVFMRVGGPDGTDSSPVSVDTMLHVRNGHVIGDNLWLWRADHAQNGTVTYTSNPCQHGLVVDGDDVIMYGLAVEHTEEDLTQWNGERGSTYFYQSELPYGVTQAQFENFTGYRVHSDVSHHHGFGVGVYTYFRDHQVNVTSGIVAPVTDDVQFVNSLSVFLNGNGGLTHILNDRGAASVAGVQPQVHYLCK